MAVLSAEAETSAVPSGEKAVRGESHRVHVVGVAGTHTRLGRGLGREHCQQRQKQAHGLQFLVMTGRMRM
jgi:hypothetical protein